MEGHHLIPCTVSNTERFWSKNETLIAPKISFVYVLYVIGVFISEGRLKKIILLDRCIISVNRCYKMLVLRFQLMNS